MPAEDFAEQERFLQRQEERERDMNLRVMAMLREEGRPDLADDLPQRLRDIDSGVHDARSTWHSISDAQCRALILASTTGNGGPAQITRIEKATVYSIRGAKELIAIGICIATVRNLAARGLLDWCGGAFNPEAEAVLSERARFVLRHGRPAPGIHFEGYRP